MALPTGAGTERLRRFTLHSNNNGWAELLSGTALHLYTIISLIFCDQAGAAGTIGIQINQGAEDLRILTDHAHVANATFVWNDKFVMEEDDDLDIYNSVTSGDWYVSYIDQDWT